MFCEYCGSPLSEGARFCSNCGRPVMAPGGNGALVPVPGAYRPVEPGRRADFGAKTTGIVAYLTWVGWFVAYVAGDRQGARFHLNQALVIHLFFLLGVIPLIGWMWDIFMVVCWVMGLSYAVDQREQGVPLLGQIHIL